MILPKSNRLATDQLAEITAIVGEFGCSLQPIVGAVRTIYATYVPASALAAVAYGADGLCIEAHVNPSTGIGDDPKQALTPTGLSDTIRQAQALWALRHPPKACAEKCRKAVLLPFES